MDKIIQLFRSPSTSMSASPPSTISNDFQPSAMVESSLQVLPAEILNQIIAHLPPLSLVDLSRTSRLLRTHSHNDLLWAKFVKDNVPNHTTEHSHFPCSTWKNLYAALHPYWFLPRHKIWFSDKAYTGSTMTGILIIAKFDPRRGCIEAYRIVAQHRGHEVKIWEWDPNIMIHVFNPKVQLWLDDPVININVDSLNGGCRLQQEHLMQTGASQGVRSLISLCQEIPETLQDPSMALWPPSLISTTHRVRNESPTMFRGDANKPANLSEASDRAFRIRKWVEFRGMGAPLGVRVGEDVMTFSTIPEESYTPTKQKPWQGIWVGDYAGHGCEFLVVVQKAVESSHDGGESVGPEEDGSCTGRLEAIKLTGDPNVPRGEYTWIAEDIGPGGLIRVADEETFKGARIVRSKGNTATRGFLNPKYISSQLIMISHDSLAQFWQEFGHIAYYSRVNIEELLEA